MSEPLFDPLVWLILLPLAWATLALVLGPGRGAWPAIAGLTAQCWLAFDLAQKVGAYGTAGHAVGGWGAPLGIDLAVDGLSAAMLLLTQTVALPLAIYARSYFKADDPAGAYVDGGSASQAKAHGFDPSRCLADNNSTAFFAVLNDLISPGPTFTNVNDFRAIMVTDIDTA